jgi:hypothetical protein
MDQWKKDVLMLGAVAALWVSHQIIPRTLPFLHGLSQVSSL